MKTPALSIAHITSEYAPLAKVGGLADMVASLAAEQVRRGHRVTVVLPGYEGHREVPGWVWRSIGAADLPWGMGVERAEFDLLLPTGPEAPAPQGLRVLRVSHAGERRFFQRSGIYNDPVSGEGYPDNGERYLFFCRAALEGLRQLGGRYQIVHAHDHQAGWIPCFLRTHEAGSETFAGAASVFTIHNLGYQGLQDPWVLALAGFGREHFYPGGPFEFWGRVNFMKVGLLFADMISTVSPRYAEEIRSSDEFGFGLEGVLERRQLDLRGILNGIDDAYWDPARDRWLSHPYDRANMAGKWKNRTALLTECGFPPQPDWPVVGMVSRLVDQKGFDLIEAAAAELQKLEARFVVLGSGQARYQDLFTRLVSESPERFSFRTGFDERFAHAIEAGADLFLMPSRYEPCGLNQMYSLRYGTVPVVRATGGLADTVEDFDPATRAGTGFVFQNYESADMVAALRRAFTVYRQPHLWGQLRANGMSRDFSWRRSAEGYDRLYVEALARVGAGRMKTLETVKSAG
ncbi:MAG: glycogen synthase [Candidatus Eisenbacteria bacterium]|uniref:Glycogen synthase n=1 Tax=Eiseniibacteriota bacterium TaxID=2212470 RepID=A0A849SR15_UNCEI|nr:glycogen synthase [Candidatus Eisenbacteria bacterium]